MNPDIVPALLAVGVMLIVAFPIHEFSHAFAAHRLGDETARYMGRMTLDPRSHFDPLGAGILALGAVTSGFFIGWAKPTPVNPMNLAGGRRGEAVVALAGPLSNLILAAVVAVPIRLLSLDPTTFLTIQASPILGLVLDVLFFLVLINVFLFIFNLLPIPPLDGWKVLLGVVDPRTAYSLRQYEQYGFILIVLLFFLSYQGILPLGEVGFAVARFLLGS
jgi:Zn-dependent protease